MYVDVEIFYLVRPTTVEWSQPAPQIAKPNIGTVASVVRSVYRLICYYGVHNLSSAYLDNGTTSVLRVCEQCLYEINQLVGFKLKLQLALSPQISDIR